MCVICIISEFSLDTWKQQNGGQIGQALKQTAVSLLFEQLKITQYLKSPECSIDDDMFKNAILGWKSGTL